jgi:hypothetical protein
LLHSRRKEADAIHYDLARKAEELAEKLEPDYPEFAQQLRNEQGQPNPVWRLSESLASLQGRDNTLRHLVGLLDSGLLSGRPNGLGSKRKATRGVAGKRSEIRSISLTDSVLDYLVHLHVLASGGRKKVRTISFKEFVDRLRDRYGICVDEAPTGMTISNDLLRANRAVLEQRLRDLGLFVGVNDAEAMKRLWPRFQPVPGNDHGMD